MNTPYDNGEEHRTAAFVSALIAAKLSCGIRTGRGTLCFLHFSPSNHTYDFRRQNLNPVCQALFP